jgi:hypothetical protein
MLLDVTTFPEHAAQYIVMARPVQRQFNADNERRPVKGKPNDDSVHRLAVELDGRRMGRFVLNKCTTEGRPPSLTVYDVANCGDAIADEQLTFTAMELIGFCREVLRVAEQFDGRESSVETGKTTELTAGTGEMLMQSA